MEKDGLLVGDFVLLLLNLRKKCQNEQEENLSQTEALHYAHFRLWIEDIDERQALRLLNRQTAARIIHNFLRIECGLPDLPDISAAKNLKDLYTCRLCANHIAQVYERGIMPACEVDEDGVFFNHLGILSKKEIEEIIKTMKKIMKNM